jgi:hypothetical protein
MYACAVAISGRSGTFCAYDAGEISTRDMAVAVAEAKRSPEPVVPPLEVGDVEIRVPNDIENMGVVEVWDPKSEKKLKDIRVYRIIIWLVTEADVQWVFIKSIALDGDALVVVDEKNKTHRVSVKKWLKKD